MSLAGRLPFEEAAQVAGEFGIEVSKSELERLAQPYGRACRKATERVLFEAKESAASAQDGRLMILEIDGVRVLGKPEDGSCQGVEIKNIVLYPANSPGQRWLLSEVREAKELPDMIEGLLGKAGVSDKDTLIGVGDGALWVEELLDNFCEQSITDVYHATQYADQVMQALSWSEEVREEQRQAWCSGKVTVGSWFEEHLPSPAVWTGWGEEAIEAIAYLDKRLPRMDYPKFKAMGFPIGSGQIEGANKWLIGARMKRSGMQWSREGAARMASMRVQMCSNKPLVEFDQLRHQAYPSPSLDTCPMAA